MKSISTGPLRYYIVAAWKGTWFPQASSPSVRPVEANTLAYIQHLKCGLSSTDTSTASVRLPPLMKGHAILREVALAHKIPLSELNTRGSRVKHIVQAKQEAVARCLLETSLNSVQISKIMGYADHSTVMHYAAKLYYGHVAFMTGPYRLKPIPVDKLDALPRKGKHSGNFQAPAPITRAGYVSRRREAELKREARKALKQSLDGLGVPGGRRKGLQPDEQSG